MRHTRFGFLIAVVALACSCAGTDLPLVLAGTVVTPGEVLDPGWVVIKGDRIHAVTTVRPDAPGAIVLDTNALIFPGLIDLHNHVSWNVFPRWTPDRQYDNHHEWRDRPDYRASMADPGRTLLAAHACDMTRYGEIRAIIGGTTSILSAPHKSCIRGLVRNLDFYSEFDPALGSGREPISTIADVTLLSDQEGRQAARRIRQRRVHALFVHLAEGRPGDRRATNELKRLMRFGLLQRETVIIHGTALGLEELKTVKAAGAALVWSPRSNMTLYGETTNVAAALDLGIPVALGPDWAVTGSSTLLDELRYAARFNELHLGGRLSERQLTAMAIDTPARLAGIDDKVGAIREGLIADVLVLHGDRSQPYRALLSARPQDIRLVLVGGRPLYGAREVVRQLHARGDWEDLTVCETATLIDMPGGGRAVSGRGHRLGALEARLQKAMTAARGDPTLAPLTECDETMRP